MRFAIPTRPTLRPSWHGRSQILLAAHLVARTIIERRLALRDSSWPTLHLASTTPCMALLCSPPFLRRAVQLRFFPRGEVEPYGMWGHNLSGSTTSPRREISASFKSLRLRLVRSQYARAFRQGISVCSA